MTVGVSLRTVVRSDAVAVGRLLDQLGYPQRGVDATAARIESWIDDQSGAVIVAESDAYLLGVIAVHVSPFFERDGTWARIVALVVDDRVRGRGIGAALIAAAESFAAARGCIRMEVTSSDHRRDAHAFYQRRGYIDQAGRSSRFLRSLQQ